MALNHRYPVISQVSHKVSHVLHHRHSSMPLLQVAQCEYGTDSSVLLSHQN